ncbi:MAG: type IV pilin N-terminal domain-containing protein [Methanoculleus sp.]|nr:type IV pilin N-terminal domain-containing protein [Methanoculleus sp.]
MGCDRYSSDDAVSEVIGVMLMISVTLIIVALVAVYATGAAGDTTQPIKADLIASGTMKNGSTYMVVFEHRAGDAFDVDQLAVSVGLREDPALHMTLRNEQDMAYIEGLGDPIVQLGDRFVVSLGGCDATGVVLPGGAVLRYGGHLTYRFIDRRTGSPVSSGEIPIKKI